jgi:hypothetical protein
MEETFKKWIEAIVPWLLNHGIKILIIAIAARLLPQRVIHKVKG